MSSVMSQNDSGRIKMLDDTIQQSDFIAKQFYTFILVNSRSGSCLGRQLLEKYKKPIFVRHGKNLITYFYAYDLYAEIETNTCFEEVKGFCLENKNVRIAIAGGDGTVQWVLSQAIKRKIDFDRVTFCVVPIGTGNDFARSVGWDKFKFEVSNKKMKQLAIYMSQSQVINYDAWDCKIDCFKSGGIAQIKNGREKHLQQKIIIKTFTNYFGVGSDAQVTYVAQKLNAKSVISKKLAYGVAGIMSTFMCAKALLGKVAQFIQRRQIILRDQIQLCDRLLDQNNPNYFTQNIQISPSDQCITFLNSTTSMELSHIWQTPRTTVPNKKFADQKVNDGLIEIVSYRNQISLALQRNFHIAKRVAQGQGPFIINFKQPKAGKIQNTYIHINGQPYKITNIQNIQIYKSKQISGSKIKVFTFKKNV